MKEKWDSSSYVVFVKEDISAVPFLESGTDLFSWSDTLCQRFRTEPSARFLSRCLRPFGKHRRRKRTAFRSRSVLSGRRCDAQWGWTWSSRAEVHDENLQPDSVSEAHKILPYNVVPTGVKCNNQLNRPPVTEWFFPNGGLFLRCRLS